MEPEVKYPELSTEEKLVVREAGFVLQSTREQAQRSVEAASKNLMDVVTNLGQKYGVDDKTTLFDLAKLAFTAKP